MGTEARTDVRRPPNPKAIKGIYKRTRTKPNQATQEQAREMHRGSQLLHAVTDFRKGALKNRRKSLVCRTQPSNLLQNFPP